MTVQGLQTGRNPPRLAGIPTTPSATPATRSESRGENQDGFWFSPTESGGQLLATTRSESGVRGLLGAVPLPRNAGGSRPRSHPGSREIDPRLSLGPGLPAKRRPSTLNSSMRLVRTSTVLLLLLASLALVYSGPEFARAQTVDDAEEAADDAARRADAASGILSDTADRQSSVEGELADSLTRLTEINAELTRIGIQLDDTRARVVLAEATAQDLDRQLDQHAVDSYMRALSTPGAALLSIADTARALVITESVGSAIDDDKANIADLLIQKRDLESLTARYLDDQEQVAELQEAADAEADHLEELLASANADLAAAVGAARAADSAYRDALGELDGARAREAAAERDKERGSTTTTTAPNPEDPTTSTTPTTTPVGDQPTTTTTLPEPPPGDSDFPAAVERWRPLVSAYFPGGRVNEALSVIKCESLGDPDAYNPYSGASGLFQFIPSTWATVSASAGFSGTSPFDAEANIASAAWLTNYYSNLGRSPWSAWACRP